MGIRAIVFGTFQVFLDIEFLGPVVPRIRGRRLNMELFKIMLGNSRRESRRPAPTALSFSASATKKSKRERMTHAGDANNQQPTDQNH
jgi:hypothetical protein